MAKRIKVKNSFFDIKTAQSLVDMLKSEINRPFISSYVSKLGGEDNTSIMLAMSTTSKGNWANGIFENSDYWRFHIENDGTVENFTYSGVKKVRKFTAKTFNDLITRLNKI